MNKTAAGDDCRFTWRGLARLFRAARLAGGVLLFCGAALVLGCSETTRYRVLSFFFDGVPPPPGMEEKSPGGKAKPGAAPASPGAPKEKAPPSAEVAKVSYHAPYRDRRCSECHSPDVSNEILSQAKQLCQKCHLDHFNYQPSDWVHGPVAARQCLFCHDGHKSQYPALLKVSLPDLCFVCHDATSVQAASYHEEAAKESCTKCHDPHFAGNRLLLADARTYQRSKSGAKTAPSAHAQWSEQDCRTCHVLEQSNRVVEDVNSQCLRCHESIQKEDSGGKLHTPVKQGLCVLCHTPHSSPLAHLISPRGEAICFECHDRQELQTEAHPRVERVNCLLCHTGHKPERPHMLRPGIPMAR